MVILPKESHGYAAKENILHLLWEQDQFFEKYLKNKKAEQKILSRELELETKYLIITI